MKLLLCLSIFLLLAAASVAEHHYSRSSALEISSREEEWSPQAYSDFHINPEYTGDPNSIAPIILDAISPWDDSGRSQMMENEPYIWPYCPMRALDCRRCPQDFRCTVQVLSSIYSPEPTAQGTPEKPTDSQSKPPKFNNELEELRCPLRRCGVGPGRACGQGATCKSGLCVCPVGRKGEGRNFRGWTYPEALNVFVDVGATCNEACKNPFCSEIERFKWCWKPWGKPATGEEGPETQIPTAAVFGRD